jgi:cytoskeletal protein RodZ
MKSDIQNSTIVEQDATPPNPPPPQFDEAMIAAAQPVEPLTNQSTHGREPLMQFLKVRWRLLGAILIVGLLSIVLFGMVSEQVVSRPNEKSTQPLAAEASIGPAVVNQSVQEAPKASNATSSVKSSTKVRDNNRPRYRRPMEWLQTKPDSPQQSERPVARKVGEIYFGRGKEDRAASHRRRDDNHNR